MSTRTQPGIVNTYVLALAYSGGANAPAMLMAVLTIGAVNDYAVYEGLVPAEAASGTAREDAAGFIARHGLKCSYERAVTYFPHLPREQYRD